MKLTKLFIAAIAILTIATPAFAAKDKADKKEKTVTITGEGKCAKCALLRRQ